MNIYIKLLLTSLIVLMVGIGGLKINNTPDDEMNVYDYIFTTMCTGAVLFLIALAIARIWGGHE